MRNTMKASASPTPYLKIVVMLLLVVLGFFVILNIDSGTPDDSSSGSVVQEEAVVEMAVKEEIQEEAEQKVELAIRKKKKAAKVEPSAVADGKDGTQKQSGSTELSKETTEIDAPNAAEAGAKTLADIAKEVAVNNVIVYTVVGDGFVHMFENWVISFIHAIGDPERHNFLAFAKSPEIYEELEKKFPGHAFYLSSEAEEAFLEKVDDKEYDRESRNVQLAYVRRPLYAMMLLQLKYDAVYADVDAVFVKNPLTPLKGGEYEVYISYNDWGAVPKKTDPLARTITPYEKDKHSISGSFIYLKNCAGSRYFLSAWLHVARSVVLSDEKKDVTDKALLQKAFWTNVNYNLARVKIGALPCYAFPASHVFFGHKVGKKDNERPWREVFKKDIRFVETSWLSDIEGKVQSLKDLHLWHIGEGPAGSR